MHEILVIGFLLFPANEQAAEAVKSGVGALDYPAAGAVAGGGGIDQLIRIDPECAFDSPTARVGSESPRHRSLCRRKDRE